MKRSWWLGVLAGVVVGAVVFAGVGGLQAQSRGGFATGRVVCLDVVKIYNEYDRQKDLEEEMRDVRQDMQNEVERRRGQIDSLQVMLDAMSRDDPMYFKKTRDMFALQLDYKNWSELVQAEMTREIGVWTRKMYIEILAATEELALRQGYDAVLYVTPPKLIGYDPEAIKEQIRSRKVVYANPTVDITQAVLGKLNADYRAQPKTQMLRIPPTLPP